MHEVWRILVEYHQAFASGLWVTLQLCASIWAIGILGGTALGFWASHHAQTVGRALHGLVFAAGSIPVLILLVWMHYPLQTAFGIVVEPFWTALAALSLVNLLMVGDLVFKALQEFPQQYVTAARMYGLTMRQTAIKIQLPMLVRQVLPSLILSQVVMLHATLLASLISVEELFRVAQRINAMIYKPVEIYTALALFFLAICLPLNLLAAWLKNRYTRQLSER